MEYATTANPTRIWAEALPRIDQISLLRSSIMQIVFSI
jgi:hypothetical protein